MLVSKKFKLRHEFELRIIVTEIIISSLNSHKCKRATHTEEEEIGVRIQMLLTFEKDNQSTKSELKHGSEPCYACNDRIHEGDRNLKVCSCNV